jgi:hypothetical protein
MTRKQKRIYSEPEVLKDILFRVLHNKRFTLECGHRISFFSSNLSNDLILRNGLNKDFKVICSDCGE